VQQVFKAFDLFAAKLSAFGINVNVIEDSADPVKPNAIFPNTWISFHEGGHYSDNKRCRPCFRLMVPHNMRMKTIIT
jgi:hypothetical protein